MYNTPITHIAQAIPFRLQVFPTNTHNVEFPNLHAYITKNTNNMNSIEPKLNSHTSMNGSLMNI